MPVNQDRIRLDIEAIARFTATPGEGADRPTFSDPWRAARDYVIEQAKAAGCSVRVDAAGNVHARPASISWNERVWLSGSHIDTVPHGGDYDGVAGVVAPLEVLRLANEENRPPPPLELIVFAEEEGTTFGLGMIGSRLWTGELGPRNLADFRNSAGENFLQAGARHDVQPNRLAEDRLRPGSYRGFVEIHIEQAASLWNSNAPVALVTAIAGRRQYRCTIRGVANHAGSTGMHERKDALVGAATSILQLEGLANGLAEHTVITVGRIECKPNAINVIPAEVSFTIDFRSPSNEALDAGNDRIRHLLEQMCSRRGLAGTIEATETIPAVQMDRELCTKLKSAAMGIGIVLTEAISGALHDAAVLAPRVPTAMLFVASRDGISHNPQEFSRVEDIATAARILNQLVNSA